VSCDTGRETDEHNSLTRKHSNTLLGRMNCRRKCREISCGDVECVDVHTEISLHPHTWFRRCKYGSVLFLICDISVCNLRAYCCI
jgi:hypothetical protein